MALAAAEIRKPSLENSNVDCRDTLVYSGASLHFLPDAGDRASLAVELRQHLSHQTIGDAHMDLHKITGHDLGVPPNAPPELQPPNQSLRTAHDSRGGC